MRFLVTIFLLAALRLSAVEWPVLGARVLSNGCWMELTLSTAPNLDASTAAVTNLNFFNGLGTNNSLTSTTALTLTLTEPGFSSLAVSQQVARTVVGTKLLRDVWPMQLTNQVTAENVTNVTVRLALSRPVFSNDVVTLDMRAGAVASTNLAAFTNSAAVVGMSVTNASVLSWAAAKVVGQPVVEERRPVFGSTTIEFSAQQTFSDLDDSTNPIACITVIASGGISGHTESNIVSALTISPRDGRAVYAVTLDLSLAAGFTRGEPIFINYVMYPKYGQLDATLNSVTDQTIQPLSIGPLKYTLMDKMFCVVDPVSGSDSTAVAGTNQAFAETLPALTISGALTRIAATNNALYSLNRTDGGEVQCMAATNYLVGKYSTQISSNGYFTITHHSSTTRAGVVFTNFVTSQNQYHLQRYYDVTFRRLTNGFIVFAAASNVLVMEKVHFADTFTGWYAGVTNSNVEFLDCVTGNSQLSPGGNAGYSRLIRNGTYTNTSGTSITLGSAQCVFGAYINGSASVLWNPVIAGMRNFLLDDITVLSSGQTYINLQKQISHVAMNRCVFESTNSLSAPLMSWSVANITNFNLRNSTLAGQRLNHENDYATPVNYFAVNWTVQNNIFTRGDHRADVNTPGNSTLIGYWPVGYSVGFSGNWNEAVLGVIGDEDFWGINCNTPPNGGLSWATTNNALYRLDASRSGTAAGNGNYRLRNASPAYRLGTSRNGIQDADLLATSESDPPGAYDSRVIPFTITGRGAMTGKGAGQ